MRTVTIRKEDIVCDHPELKKRLIEALNDLLDEYITPLNGVNGDRIMTDIRLCVNGDIVFDVEKEGC